MNTFCEHHKHSIKFGYRCFDRILLNGLIQPFQQPERVIGFFNAYREGRRVTRNCLRDIAEQFQNWVKNRCQKWGVPILDAPEGRRDDFVDPYFKHAKDGQVVVILKAREPARIMIAIGAEERWHLELAQRWMVQDNFYINDPICLSRRAFVSINTTGWLSACVPKASILSNVPMHSSNAVIRTSSSNWPIP